MIERFGFDRDWFSRFLGRELFADWQTVPGRPAIETRVEEGKFIVHADLPGIDPKDVDIKVVGDVLAIKGSREEKKETKKADYLRREIRYGAFERSVGLPEGIKPEDLKATYHDGVLELTAPMPKEAIPKEVKIQIEAPKGNSEKKAVA
ncbi:MAG: Hsp20/alpha crystallin family protein [Candidatus Binataceae bacterium]